MKKDTIKLKKISASPAARIQTFHEIAALLQSRDLKCSRFPVPSGLDCRRTSLYVSWAVKRKTALNVSIWYASWAADCHVCENMHFYHNVPFIRNSQFETSIEIPGTPFCWLFWSGKGTVSANGGAVSATGRAICGYQGRVLPALRRERSLRPEI